MHAGKRERVDSLDVRSSFLHGSTVTFGRFFRICKRRISSGELRGCFQMRSYIGVGILTGFLCLEFGELLVMPHC
ncbi:hypothetical protein Goshw_019319 [Gossypium schwendimanii]|uniref:Uncharacterized protein n=1 Tax=Gossypium schwendimanii TaxID=34291 RepID=A0A7J9NEM8_GOSSC|nr:hypothetical protein [Gossypium schwendimanii]